VARGRAADHDSTRTGNVEAAAPGDIGKTVAGFDRFQGTGHSAAFALVSTEAPTQTVI